VRTEVTGGAMQEFFNEFKRLSEENVSKIRRYEKTKNPCPNADEP